MSYIKIVKCWKIRFFSQMFNDELGKIFGELCTNFSNSILSVLRQVKRFPREICHFVVFLLLDQHPPSKMTKS